MRVKELYEDDFVAWTEGQARELRALHTSRWNGPLDLEHLAEEMETCAAANAMSAKPIFIGFTTCLKQLL